MQIHELNTLNRLPSDTDYLAIDTGFDTAKIPAKKLFASETIVSQAVQDWLDDHPEATTTVQDGSITEPKLADTLKDKVMNDYITPQMFGAAGDGVTDDTAALRDAIYHSHTYGNILYIPAEKKYYVTGALNYHAGAYYNCTLNVLGCNPTKHGEYSLSKYGGIILADGCNLFAGSDGNHLSSISGNMRNLSIVGKTRATNTSIFHFCDLRGLYVFGCNMSQIGAIMRDSITHSLATFDSNIFLTAYYFAKYDGGLTNAMGLTDSVIKNNYINGGEELNNNACFEFTSYNGTLITGNFIDYYQCIYRPKAKNNVTCVGPASIGNNYQVFRHLYWFDATNNHINIAEKWSFIGDIFNWTDVTKLEKLTRFEKYTYVDRDGNTQDHPPCIFSFRRSQDSITMEDAIIQDNVAMSNLVYVSASPVSYAYGYGKFTCNINPVYINAISLAQGTKPIWNWASHMYNHLDIDVVLTVESLPQFALDWSVAFPGMKVLYNKVVYTATNYWNGSTWQARWLDKFGNAPA